MSRKIAGAGEIDLLVRCSTGADDANGRATIAAVESRVAVINTDLQRMRAAPVERRKIVDLEQFVSTALAMLAIEPATKVSFRSDLIRRATVTENVAVKLFDAEARLQQFT